MAIKGKTFDLQTITAKDDGALYRILSGESDMIVFSGSGTALSITSNILTIAECYLLVGGRYIHIEGGSTIDLGTIPNSSNRGRVIIKIDTSLGATQVSLAQVVPEIETIASGGSYRALVQNDINSDNGGSVYEMEFATFTCSSGVASSPALTTSVPTQTKIQALQDDIDTLADNIEQIASDVGDLQIPDIVQFTIDKSSYSHQGYANLQITTRSNISGDTSFTSANTDYWNIQLNPGIYRMDLYCSFQSSSAVATDVGIGLGNNATRRPTPIEARVQTTGSIIILNASGVLKVTSYDDLYSFLIYMGDTTARDIGGYWTIERIG